MKATASAFQTVRKGAMSIFENGVYRPATDEELVDYLMGRPYR